MFDGKRLSMYRIIRADTILKSDHTQADAFKTRSNLCFLSSILGISGLSMILTMGAIELGSTSNAPAMYACLVSCCAVACAACLVFVVWYARKHGLWWIPCVSCACDTVMLVAICFIVVLCIHAAPGVRALYFDMMQALNNKVDSGDVQIEPRGIMPPIETNDTSLHDGYASLTHFAQTTILRHQNECNSARFMVASFDKMGLSAMMHSYASVLGMAMDQGKIFAWSETSCSEYFVGNCRAFFMDEHGCSVSAVNDNTITDRIADGSAIMDARVPQVFMAELSRVHPSMTIAQAKYWWKTQAVSYLMRYNTQTQNEVNAMRADVQIHPVLGGVIPAQTVNIQMRRGDKYDEMNIEPVSKYIAAAEKLFNDMPYSYSRWVFLTGDELASLQKAADLARANNWGVIYSEYPRMKDGYVLGKMRSFGWGRNSTITGLMDLDMALDCGAWIGTRASGWSRLYDEFRCVKVPKCHGIFVEVGSLPEGQYAPVVQ